MADGHQQAQAPATLSYEDWGAAFFEQAVTPERVLAAVSGLAGRPIDVGPVGVGPGRIAQVRAQGSIGEPRCTRVPGEAIAYHVVLPVELGFGVDLQLDTSRFRARIEVPLLVTARPAPPLRILIDIVPPRPEQITVDLRAAGLRASMLNRVVDIEAELQRFVAQYVAREVAGPEIAQVREIDVAAAIDGALRSIGGRGGTTAAGPVDGSSLVDGVTE